MIADYTLYTAICIITTIISLVLARIAFRHNDRVGASALGWLMLGVSGWCLLPGVSLLLVSAETAYLVTRAAYLFFAAVPVLWIRFTYQYVKRQLPANPRLFSLLWICPVISLSLVWTNQWHHWFWRDLVFFRVDGFLTWNAVFGPGFWFHTLYSYSLILLGTFIIIRYAITSFAVYRMQTIALLIGCLAPILTSLPAVLGMTRLPLTPFGLVITGLAYTWAVLRSGLLDLRPIARNLLIEQIQDGMIIVDERYIVVDVNPPAVKLLGGNESKVLGLPADEVIATLTGRDFQIKSQTHFRTEITLLRSGQAYHLLLSLSPLLGFDQQLIGYLIHLHDITGLKKIEGALRASESHSRAILAALPDSVHIIDQDGTYQDMPQNSKSRPAEAQTPTPASLFDVFLAPLAENMLQAVRAALLTETCQSFTYELQAEDGAKRWFEARIAPLASETGQPARVVWIDREVTERVQLYQKVEHLANTDSLTGLANRRRFFTQAQEFVDQNSPLRSPCAFILVDIDHFKQVNDQFGHLVGDEVLNYVASRLAQQVRCGDFVARYGGEEFAVLLPKTSQAEANKIAQRLCRAIAAEPYRLGNQLIPLSISIGMVNALVGTNLQIDQMIEKADDALYAAKHAGRNTVKINPTCL